MFNKIKGLASKYAKSIAGVAGMFVLGLAVMASNVHAAADIVLTNLTTSSTSFLGDNLTVIMDFIVLNFFKITGAGLGIMALYWIARKIYSLFRR